MDNEKQLHILNHLLTGTRQKQPGKQIPLSTNRLTADSDHAKAITNAISVFNDMQPYFAEGIEDLSIRKVSPTSCAHFGQCVVLALYKVQLGLNLNTR